MIPAIPVPIPAPMTPHLRLALRILLTGVFVAWPVVAEGRLEFRRPDSDTEIVAILNGGATPAADRELRHLRQRASDPAVDRSSRLATARRCLQRHRETADPRFLGAAMATLGDAWTAADAEPELRVLRANVRQSLHEFDAAEADLAAALNQDPRHVPAWLLLAHIQCVRGRWDAARRSAVQLARLADPLTATTLAAEIASVTGHPDAARDTLERAIARDRIEAGVGTDERRAIRRWATKVLAELLETSGEHAAADRTYRQALAEGAADPHLLATYADFLLDQGRASEVPGLLHGWESVDALALRIAEATRDPDLTARLGRRFDAARSVGERLHQREAARFELRLRQRPREAVALARENWAIQREVADFRILAEAAAASGDAEALAEVAAWGRCHPPGGILTVPNAAPRSTAPPAAP